MRPHMMTRWISLTILTALASAAAAQPDSAGRKPYSAGPPVRRISTASAVSVEDIGAINGVVELRDGRVLVNDGTHRRLPNNLHVSFIDVDGESLLIGISDIAVSSGSACSSASGLASHVLRAIMGDNVPSASIRFGLGRGTTDDDIDYTVGKFVSVVRHLRSTAPVR